MKTANQSWRAFWFQLMAACTGVNIVMSVIFLLGGLPLEALFQFGFAGICFTSAVHFHEKPDD